MSLNKKPLVALAVGLLVMFGMAAFAMQVPSPTDFQRQVFQTLLAVGAGIVAVAIPGTVSVKVSKLVTGTGALSVMILVYLVSPTILKQRNSERVEADAEIDEQSVKSENFRPKGHLKENGLLTHDDPSPPPPRPNELSIDLTEGGFFPTGKQGPSCDVVDGALVMKTRSIRKDGFSMCCIDLLSALDLEAFPLGVAEVDVATAERVDVKLEVADTDKHIFIGVERRIEGRKKLKYTLTAKERNWKPNRVCIAGLDKVPNNTIKLFSIGLKSGSGTK